MKLDYPQKRNGMYILNKNDFDVIANAVLGKYSPGNLKAVRPLDIDYLLQDCLYLEIVPKFLSRDGSVLGMIAFEDSEWWPVTGIDPEMEIIPAGTVCIDPTLLGIEQRGRCRFTKAHEGSHWILHRSYHSPDHRVFSFRQSDVPAIACRASAIERFTWKHDHVWSEHDWEEWQADSLAAAMLMPRDAFKDAFQTAMSHHGFRQSYLVKGERVADSKEVITEVANRFAVSRRAAQIRMCQFNLIRQMLG